MACLVYQKSAMNVAGMTEVTAANTAGAVEENAKPTDSTATDSKATDSKATGSKATDSKENRDEDDMPPSTEPEDNLLPRHSHSALLAELLGRHSKSVAFAEDLQPEAACPTEQAVRQKESLKDDGVL